MGEPASDVVGIGCLLESCQVARDARRRQPDEYSAGVTTVATERDMCAGQWKCCLGVIKDGAQPVRGAVTDGAIRRKTRGRVVRVSGLLVGRQMTTRALGWR